MSSKNIFENLFVLELANNHWGKIERALKIIDEHGVVVQKNNTHAAIKFQFRDVDNFIHPHFKLRTDLRYINKTLATKLSWDSYKTMVDRVKGFGMVTMATPFDEFSVDKCMEFDLDIIKIASSDMQDKNLLSKIAETKKPVIASSGGSSTDEQIDFIVDFFCSRNIPFALNHCVSLYPSEDSDLELNQIDYLKGKYPHIMIGFSTHEYHDWSNSIMMAYAKGARTFERHIDIEYENVPVSSYCSLPHQMDIWFKAFHKAVEMCGNTDFKKRTPPNKEVRYLDALVRGVYAKEDFPEGYRLEKKDVFFAVPLLKGQISSREFSEGEVLKKPISKHDPLLISEIQAPYSEDKDLVALIQDRGLEY